MATAAVRTTGRGGNRGVTATAALSITAALVLSGCGSSAKPSDKPASTPTASASSTDPDAAAKKQVLAVVKGMHKAQAAAYTQGTEKNTHLETYAADKALAGIRSELFNYKQASILFQGAPQLSGLQVTAIDLQESPKKATVEGCMDTSHWTPMQNGSQVPVKDASRRYPLTESLRTIGTNWFVIAYQLHKDRSC